MTVDRMLEECHDDNKNHIFRVTEKKLSELAENHFSRSDIKMNDKLNHLL